MSKTVGKVLAVAAVVVGVVAAIPTAGASLGLSAAALSALSVGIAAAAMLNSALVKSGAKSQLQVRQASVVALQLGEVPREALFGTTLTGGSLADAFNYGGKYGTDWECRVIALADHRCDGLVGLYVNDAYVDFAGDGPVAGYNGQLEVYWRPGTTDQTVPAVVLANGSGWTPSDIGYGVAWVAVCYKADAADAKTPVWPAGRPAFSWLVRGKRCYQARRDSSVGGSGAHRWSDPSTWEWTDNPIDCRYNWVRGVYAGDRVGEPGMLLVGRGLTPTEAPPVNAFAPANVCDEPVPLDAGGSEPRYRANGVIKADETYIDVEEHFAAACGGVILQPEGAVEIEPGQAKAPVFFFSDDDLLVGSSVEFIEDLSEADDAWVNTVVPRYVEPSLKYADHAAPIRRLVADVIADGGPREQSLSLSLVTSATQAGRVGEIARRMGRLLRRGQVTLGPSFAEIEEGDWGVWTSQRYLKGASVLFRVEAYALDAAWHNTLNLREMAAAVYAKDADAASTSVALQQDVPAIVQPGADAWAVSAPATTTETPLPSIVVTGATDTDYAELVRFEIASAAGVADPALIATWTEAGLAGPDVRRFEVTAVSPATSYYAAVSYVVGRVPGARRILGPVTSAMLTIPVEAVEGLEDLRTVIDNALETIEDAADAIRGISDDGILTIDEKIRILKPADAQLEAAWQLLDGQAAGISGDTAVASARTTASNARQAWQTYRNGLSPAWNNLQQATAINRTTFNGKLGDYEWSLTNLAQALRDYGLRRTNAAFETVARLGSDGWLTAGSEKQQAEIEYQALVSRLAAVVNRWQGLGQPALSPAAALSDAGFALYPEYGPANGRPASLGYYLEHLNPSYLSRNTDTQVDPAEWSARWKTAYDKIAIAEAALIGIVSSAVQSAVDAIAVISADGKWSPYEKRSTLLQQHAELEANYTLLNNAATAITGSAALDTARSTAGTKRQAWLDFLNTVPSWSNPDVETTVNRGEARSKVVAYGDALNALAEALRVYTDSKAVSALQRLDDIANDGKIAPEEKWQTVMLWRNLVNRYQRGVDRYLELGLQSGRIPAVSQKQQAAYNALGPDGNAPDSSLGKFLGGLTPQWDRGDVTTNVPDPTALKSKFEAASNAVDAFLVAMSAQPDADNTSSAIASGAADGTINNKVNASPKLSKLDSTGRAVSTRINSIYALRGAQQVYVPTNGNSNQGGTVQAGVPGSPLWSYTDPGGGPTATIQVFDHKLIDDEGTLNFGGGFMFNVQQGTQYWVYEDGAGYSGGNPTYVATTSAEALNAPNRRMVGSTFTPRTAQVGAGGGTSGGGGGGGGIRERYYENQRTVQP